MLFLMLILFIWCVYLLNRFVKLKNAYLSIGRIRKPNIASWKNVLLRSKNYSESFRKLQAAKGFLKNPLWESFVTRKRLYSIFHKFLARLRSISLFFTVYLIFYSFFLLFNVLYLTKFYVFRNFLLD